MIVDSQDRASALHPGRSFIVEAPAGSGKTALLVQRFLNLLSTVNRPESVVAITFTRKAAAEMKERIIQALTDAASNAPPPAEEFKRKTRELAAAALAQDRAHNWNLAADPSRLQIQTIDSLCALLTRQMPVLSEFGGVGEIIEQPSELYLEAARETLMLLAEGDEARRAAFHRILIHFDNNVPSVETHVIKMLAKRDQWEHLTAAGTGDDQLVNDLCQLLTAAESRLRAVFQRAGKVDFTEISRAARRALGKPDSPTDLLYSLDYRIQHLLVDEFQDTSHSQYELIEALTGQWSLDDDHTLFLVGDPMQSIYRFREADVSLFLKCWEQQRIGGVQLTPVRLQTNFRTTAAVLDWIQTHFDPLMPADDFAAAAIKFRRSVSGRPDAGPAPRIVAHIAASEGKSETDEIVDIIQQSPNRTVAILIRTRTHVGPILTALRRAAIPYEAVEIESLQDQQHIIDILSLARAITNLADRVAWLACLRAPWCGLSLADLSSLAEGRPKDTILDLLSQPETISALSVDGRWRAVRVQEILSNAVEKVGRASLRSLVEETWLSLGGLAVVHQTNQREDIETLFHLMEETERGGVIRDFTLLDRKLESLFARPSSADCKVKIMTVHQAKGLEFDTVILPIIEKRARESENEILLWAERETNDGIQLSIAAIPQTGQTTPEYDALKAEIETKDSNEINRLFYVACTRAINELHLIGTVKEKKNGGLQKPDSGSFLRLLWDRHPYVEALFQTQYSQRIRSAEGAVRASRSRSFLRRLPLSWAAPQLARPIQTTLPVRRAVASERPVSYRWVGDTTRHSGTIIHELLKRVAAEGLDRWSPNRVSSMKAFIGAELLRLGVPREEKRTATDNVLRAVNNTIASERGRWILSPHPQARSEWAITGRVNDTLVSGAVDRAFLDDGTYWIIDFKNSEHEGGSREAFLAAEKLRYHPQLESYAAVVSRLVNAPVNLGLYFPLLDAWLAWQFSEATFASN